MSNESINVTMIEEGMPVVLRTSDPAYGLGMMRDPGDTAFVGSVPDGTIGIYRGHWDDLTPEDAPRLGKVWHAIEVYDADDLSGEDRRRYVPAAEGQFEPTGTCPRCHDAGAIQVERTAGNALSRVDNDTYVCSACGTDEAVGNGLVPLAHWPIDRLV